MQRFAAEQMHKGSVGVGFAVWKRGWGKGDGGRGVLKVVVCNCGKWKQNSAEDWVTVNLIRVLML